MKRIILSIIGLVGLLTAPVAFAQTAQTPFSQSAYYASSFNIWSIQNQLPNNYSFAGRGVCNSSAQGTPFFVFNTNAKVYIADQVTTNSEVVTPSAIVNTAGSCGVTVSPSNSHYTFQLRSGTGGLQEAINTLSSSSAYPVMVILDRNFYAGAAQVPGTNAPAIIAAAKGNASVIFQDITTAPYTYYVPSSTTAYTSGTWTNAKPTAAAGTGAGTGPTIAETAGSTALNQTVNLTTGTSTSAAALYTLTYATTGQFLYAPTCTVTSTGANSFTAFTTATTYSASAAVLTVTATSAPTASTAYQFTSNCK